MGRRSILVVIILLLVGIVICPFICGMVLQQRYQELLALYNAKSSYFHVTTQAYHRHWFSSDVTLKATINRASLQPDQSGLALPAEVGVIIEQHIKHGPIFFINAPAFFGLAFIQNRMNFSPEFYGWLSSLGITEMGVESDSQFITLRGNYYAHFKINNWKYRDPEKHDNIHISAMEGGIWIYPQRKAFKGKLSIANALFVGQKNSLQLKNGTLYLDQSQESHGLWIGDHNLTAAEISYHDAQAGDIKMADLAFSGSLAAEQDFLRGEKKLTIKQFAWEDEVVGPIKLQFNLNKINIPGILNIIATYQEVMQTGELYRSRLRNRLLDAIPKLVVPGTSLHLEELNAVTPDGNLQLSGKLQWSKEVFLSGDDIPDLIKLADKTLSLQVSKKLVNKLMGMAAQLPYFLPTISNAERTGLTDARDQINLAVRENASLLETLVDLGVLPENTALDLIGMQKQVIPPEDYIFVVKDLLLTKKITLPVSYLLYFQYAKVAQPHLFLEHKVDEYQAKATQNLQNQLNDLIKKKYMTEKNGNYVVDLQWLNGVLTTDGEVLP